MIPAVLSTAVLFSPAARMPVLAADAVLLVLLLADLWTMPKHRHFTVVRELPVTFSVGHFHTVRLIVSSVLRRNINLRTTDYRPDNGETRDLPCNAGIGAGGRLAVDYRLAMHTRGQYTLETVYIQVSSRLGLWQRRLVYDCRDTVHVYPDLKTISQYALLARRNQSNLIGIRSLHRTGGDNEFERLREYRSDDDFRQIAWKATAKRDKLISKAFQVTQNQSVIFMLDCGRMMLNKVGDTTFLDDALDATLLLSYIALRNSDRVGLLAFSERIEAYVPPNTGSDQMKKLIHTSYNRFPSTNIADYRGAFEFLNQRRRKRCMLILIANIIDEQVLQTIDAHLTRATAYHLPVFVILRDREVERMAEAEPKTETQYFRRAAAAEYLMWRHKAIENMKKRGVLCLELHPENLSASLINEYLRVKAANLL